MALNAVELKLVITLHVDCGMKRGKYRGSLAVVEHQCSCESLRKVAEGHCTLLYGPVGLSSRTLLQGIS